MSINTILIVADGDLPKQGIINHLKSDVDLTIAADGGAVVCRKKGLIPDFIVGDLDSCSADIIETFSDSKIIKLEEQETTDLEKALHIAEEYDPKVIYLISVFGLRTDHALGNLLVLIDFFKKHNVRIKIFDNHGFLTFLKPGNHKIEIKPQTTISLLAFEPIKALTLNGFKYLLKNADFKQNFTGISNVVLSKKTYLKFAKGILCLYQVDSA